MRPLERYDALIERPLTELRAHSGRRLVARAVFGSVGRGTPLYGSGIELLLVVHDLPRGRFRRVEELLPVEARLEPL